MVHLDGGAKLRDRSEGVGDRSYYFAQLELAQLDEPVPDRMFGKVTSRT